MVQPVVRGDIEALLGIVREPKLGHFLVFGLGGVFAEAINDIAMIPVTASTQQIRDALGRTRLGAVLTSSRWRGDRSADQFVTAAVAPWVPVIHPCWSGGMPVLVEGAAEPVRSADIEARGPLWIGHRFRAAGTAVRRYGASGGAVLVIELLELPQRVQD